MVETAREINTTGGILFGTQDTAKPKSRSMMPVVFAAVSFFAVPDIPFVRRVPLTRDMWSPCIRHGPRTLLRVNR